MAIQHITLQEGKKVYFASDNHLGAPSFTASRPREKEFIRWLDHVKEDAAHIFLMGDLFDFWFEYKTVVPKGFTRTLGKLAEIADSGIPITYFVGNHDLWMNGYFEEELGIPVYHKPQEFLINEQRYLIAHGDGLGPGDHGFKLMKRSLSTLFVNGCSVGCIQIWGCDWGNTCRSTTRSFQEMRMPLTRVMTTNGWFNTVKKKVQEKDYANFVFGHRHLPLEIDIDGKAKYTNLGDWINYFTYAVCDGNALRLEKWKLNSSE